MWTWFERTFDEYLKEKYGSNTREFINTRPALQIAALAEFSEDNGGTRYRFENKGVGITRVHYFRPCENEPYDAHNYSSLESIVVKIVSTVASNGWIYTHVNEAGLNIGERKTLRPIYSIAELHI